MLPVKIVQGDKKMVQKKGHPSHLNSHGFAMQNPAARMAIT